MRRYELVFDDGHREYIDADGPAAAVAAREGGTRTRMPRTMTDLTAMREWVSSRTRSAKEPS